MRPLRKGFLLVTALLIVAVMLLLGAGLLGSQAARYQAVGHQARVVQARALAMSGLEDARIKLEKDLFFPPPPGPGQTTFSYSETVALPGNPPFDEGTYAVLIDNSQTIDPNNYGVIVVTSLGSLGPSDDPVAQYRIRAELDLRPPDTSPTYFRYLRWQDDASL